MAKGNNPRPSNGTTLDFEVQVCVAADIFRADLHPDLKPDYIFANPPFYISDWGGENLRQDMRWKFGMPSVKNAICGWNSSMPVVILE